MRILVIEDEKRIADSIKKGLEQEHYAVDVTYDGEEGYALAVSESYDLLILDLMLPGMNGLTICQKLREEDRDLPILMLTAKSQVRDKVTGLDAGADDYLGKPFAFEELQARVRALSRRPTQVLANVLIVRDLSLNTQTYSVKRGDRELNLSHKEFTLLKYLMRHAGQTISKKQLIHHVWDYEADILPNTVEVHIKNLRQKIDQPFSKKKPLLLTVRGFGYQLGNKADV